jgi:guanine nucleotide-binding protein subunit alpha
MQESIDVFDSMINHQWFARTPWILFLNKKDLFSNKIKTTDMSKTFSDYKGGRSYDNGAKFIEGLFLKCLKSRNTQSLYVHFTCALDTQQVKFVFNSVAEWIFKQRVAMSGI